MRERLIQLIKQAHTDYLLNDDYAVSIYEFIADRLIEDGVIVLPCKVGDTVYRICKRKYDVDGYGMQFITDWGIIRNAFSLKMYHELGKTVFLTREAAEAALKARKQNGK